MTRARPAYTLVEVLMVLAIAMVLAAISVASIKMISADHATVAASDLVRAKWALARSRSINDNVPYVFGVVWNENVWRIAPEGPDYWGPGASTTQEGDSTSGSVLIDFGKLPGDVRFVEIGSPSLADPLSPSPDPASVAAESFVPLMTFYPDGSMQSTTMNPDGTSPDTMHLHLEGKTKSRLAVSMRTLTGVTTKSWKMPNGQGSGDSDRDDR